jgi:surfactin synthase thioesterase subunit
MALLRHTARHWLPFGEPATARARLFCFPHAGGGAGSFAAWRDLAGPRLTVCPVQPPGRAERFCQPPHHTIESYVDELVASLGDQFTGTYALFGHSVGALVAYRLACRLLAEGRTPPVHLFVSGRAAPHLPYRHPRLHALPVAELVPHLRALGGTPDAVLADPELLEVFLPLLRADFAVNETYRHVPGERLGIPLTAFGGRDDARADPAELRAWQELTDGPFAAHLYPGGHFYLAEHAAGLLSEIRRALKRDSTVGKPVGETTTVY